MCGAIDLRELAPPSVGKGAADRVVTLRREAAAFLPAASFELRAHRVVWVKRDNGLANKIIPYTHRSTTHFTHAH